MLLSSVFGDLISNKLLLSKGRYNNAEAQTCTIQPPRISIVPWKPNFFIRNSMSIGKTKLPAAVPDTQIPLANARRLLKYNDTIIMPGVVDKPPPMPKDCWKKNFGLINEWMY